MKRKFLIGATIFVATILLTVSTLAIFPGISLITNEEVLNVSKEEDVELKFYGAKLKLIPWDNDEIKILESSYHRNFDSAQVEMVHGDSSIELNLNLEDSSKPASPCIYYSLTWVTLLQLEKYLDYSKIIFDYTYVDFYIYVPKDVHIDLYCSGIINTSHDDIDFDIKWLQ